MTDHESTRSAERALHRMERTIDVAATPEQVWDAIATAGGLATWMAPTRLDPVVGGEVSFDFGDLTSTGVVTAYEPGRRFAYEEPWPLGTTQAECPAGMAEWFATLGVSLEQVYADLPSITPLATEFLVESISGGSSVVRVVSSSFGTGADWEHEFFTEMVSGFGEMLDRLAAQLNAPAG